uniref:Uncharacterized protein n=1 Tax=Branchiostoma floridae TaxID=7739 RepID=C3YWA2_BRAFL|eukprot:XP_002599419.1 hypothetical protein BRAFLDRAFT_106562 [Branchiostoma floridae]
MARYRIRVLVETGFPPQHTYGRRVSVTDQRTNGQVSQVNDTKGNGADDMPAPGGYMVTRSQEKEAAARQQAFEQTKYIVPQQTMSQAKPRAAKKTPMVGTSYLLVGLSGLRPSVLPMDVDRA